MSFLTAFCIIFSTWLCNYQILFKRTGVPIDLFYPGLDGTPLPLPPAESVESMA